MLHIVNAYNWFCKFMMSNKIKWNKIKSIDHFSQNQNIYFSTEEPGSNGTWLCVEWLFQCHQVKLIKKCLQYWDISHRKMLQCSQEMIQGSFGKELEPGIEKQLRSWNYLDFLTMRQFNALLILQILRIMSNLIDK